MQREYDFSTAERSKFFHEDAKLNVPMYLHEEVRVYLQEHAASKGIQLAQLVNEMLKQNITLIESVK